MSTVNRDPLSRSAVPSDPETASQQAASSKRQTLDLPRGYRVPMRRGSEYTDALLRRVFGGLQEDCRMIGVTSCRREPAVATTAANLATRAADHLITPTLLVDANANAPTLTRQYRCQKVGLTDCLIDQKPIDSCVQRTRVEGLSVMGIGDRRSAAELPLHSEFLTDLRHTYSSVLFSLPPLGKPSHFDSTLEHLDGLIVVARYGERRSQLEQLRQHIEFTGSRVLGLVMTGESSAIPGWLRRFF